jgi:hypothetical protein
VFCITYSSFSRCMSGLVSNRNNLSRAYPIRLYTQPDRGRQLAAGPLARL